MMTIPGEPRQPPIVSFYDSDSPGVDYKNRRLTDILSYSNNELELSHNYIQVLFPLPEGSPFNPSAPLIDEATFATFRQRPELRNSIHRAFRRMLVFYGFQLLQDSTTDQESMNIVPGNNADRQFRIWVKAFNHNHLRITRIIRSLRVLGLEDEAAAFFHALGKVDETHPGKISSRSLTYWTRAAKRPLYVAPDDEREEQASGPAFLWSFEERHQALHLDVH